jgi:hypothetical protein
MMPVYRKSLGERAVRTIAGCGFAGLRCECHRRCPSGTVRSGRRPAARPKVTYDDHVRPICASAALSCHNQNGSRGRFVATNRTPRRWKAAAAAKSCSPATSKAQRLWTLVAHIEEHADAADAG